MINLQIPIVHYLVQLFESGPDTSANARCVPKIFAAYLLVIIAPIFLQEPSSRLPGRTNPTNRSNLQERTYDKNLYQPKCAEQGAGEPVEKEINHQTEI